MTTCGEANQMNDMAGKPDWDSDRKDECLEQYGAWLNGIARSSFLSDGGHPEMYFFVKADGEVVPCNFPDGHSTNQKNDLILRAAAQFRPVGTFHLRIGSTSPPASTGRPEGQGISSAGAKNPESDGPERDALLLAMESKTGKVKLWLNPIIADGKDASLGAVAKLCPRDD